MQKLRSRQPSILSKNYFRDDILPVGTAYIHSKTFSPGGKVIIPRRELSQ